MTLQIDVVAQAAVKTLMCDSDCTVCKGTAFKDNSRPCDYAWSPPACERAYDALLHPDEERHFSADDYDLEFDAYHVPCTWSIEGRALWANGVRIHSVGQDQYGIRWAATDTRFHMSPDFECIYLL